MYVFFTIIKYNCRYSSFWMCNGKKCILYSISIKFLRRNYIYYIICFNTYILDIMQGYRVVRLHKSTGEPMIGLELVV